MDRITLVEHLRACALAAKNYTANLVGELAETTAAAAEELHNLKADKPQSTAFIIPIDGWSNDNTVVYPHYYDITAAGVTVHDRVDIAIVPSSMDTAKACGLCPATETLTGKIRVRAIQIPTTTIAAEYWIENGKES